jgi:hypothetical protein
MGLFLLEIRGRVFVSPGGGPRSVKNRRKTGSEMGTFDTISQAKSPKIARFCEKMKIEMTSFGS